MNLIYILGTQFVGFFNSKHFLKLTITSILFAGAAILLMSALSTYIQQGAPLTGPSVIVYTLIAALATIMPKVPVLILQMQYIGLLCILFSLWDISNSFTKTRGVAQLAAMLIGYLYVLYIKGNINDAVTKWLQKVKIASTSRTRFKKEYQLEQLLDKIAKDGYSSLTLEEKKALLDSDQ